MPTQLTTLTKYHLQSIILTSIQKTSPLKKVSKAVKGIKTGKSPGNDHNVTAEALKPGGDQLIEYLRQIFNIV